MSKALISDRAGRNILADPKRVKWVLERVDCLKKIVDKAYLEFTELLYEIAEGQYHKEAGYDSFEEYIEKRFGWQKRKGWYFVSIQKKLILEAGVPKEELEEVGWVKARELAQLPPAELKTVEQKKEWVKKAKESTHIELKAEVNRAKNKALGERKFIDQPYETITFGFAPAQMKTVELALSIARKISGEKKVKSFLMEMICLSFAAERCEEMEVKLERILQSAERVYEVELVAVRVKGKERQVIHGLELAKRIAKDGVG